MLDIIESWNNNVLESKVVETHSEVTIATSIPIKIEDRLAMRLHVKEDKYTQKKKQCDDLPNSSCFLCPRSLPSVPLYSLFSLQSSLSDLSLWPITSITLTLLLPPNGLLSPSFSVSLSPSPSSSPHFCLSYFLHFYVSWTLSHSAKLTLSAHCWTNTGYVQLF